MISRSDLFDLRYPQGFLPATGETEQEVEAYRNRIREHGFFMEREPAEADSSFKQIIPYLVVHHDGDLLQVRRLEEQSEERLHSLLSIGLGGHLNPIDRDASALLEAGINRELTEELHMDTSYDPRFIGVVNDDSNDVGSVHFGLTYRIDLSTRDVSIRETDHMEGAFESVETLAERNDASRERFETWSRMLLDRADTLLEV